MSTVQADKWLSYDGQYERYPCLAMCKFAGTGAILLAGNVSSITRLSQGHWRVTFTKPLPSADYVVSANVTAAVSVNHVDGVILYNQDNNITMEPPTVNGFTMGVVSTNGAAWCDPNILNFAVHARLP